jgi:hypothetical protein
VRLFSKSLGPCETRGVPRLLIGKGGGSYACLLPSLYGPQIKIGYATKVVAD